MVARVYEPAVKAVGDLPSNQTGLDEYFTQEVASLVCGCASESACVKV